MEAGAGPSILIAGKGVGHLEGSSAGTILVGGTTDFDRNLKADEALFMEWSNPSESYLQRVANLQNAPAAAGGQTVYPNGSYTAGYYLTAATVHDNGVADHLESHGGLDWFFAQQTGSNRDKIDGLTAGDILIEIH